MILGFGEASAQSSATWTGGGGSGSWSNSANWSTLPTTAGTWQLTFGGNTQPTSNNDIGTINLTTLTFSNDGALGQTSTFTLSGSTLGLSNGVISTVSVSGLPVNEDAIGNGLLMSGSSTIVLGTGHNLTIAGDISGLGASLTKSGAGQLFLTGSNSYTGTTYITNGTVRTGSTGPNASFNNYALGTGDVVVSGSSMLEVRNSSTVSNNLTISGVGSSASGMQAGPLNGSFGASNQTAVVSGSVTLAGDAIISTWGTADVVNSKLLLSGPVDIGSHALTFRRVPQSSTTCIEAAGSIRGSGSVTVDGGARLYLTGSNSYSGTTYITDGVVRTGSSGPNASFNNDAFGTGEVVVSGSAMLEVRNSSTVSNNLTISGVGSSASGMQAGPLNGSFGASNQTAVVSGSVTLAGDAIISTWGTAGVVNSKLLLSGPVDIGSHALTFRRVPQSATTTIEVGGSIRGTGPVTVDGGAYVYLTGSNSYTGTTYITDGVVRTGSNGPNASFNNYALGTGDVVVSGSSMLEVRNSSTVSNNLTISGVGSSASGMQAGPLNGSFGASNQTAVVSGSVTLAGDAIISTWGTAGVVNSKLLLSGPVDIGSHALTFRRVPQAASTFIEVGGAIGGSGTVTVDGDGASVYLNGANTYTGATTVLTGTLGGSGTLVSDVTVKTGATITPGSAANTTGALGVGALVLESGATAAMSISGTSIGLFDQIVAVNNVTYGGTLAIDFTTDAFANFDAWQLFSGAGHDGHFSSVVATGPGAFSNLTFSYLGDGEWQATGGSLADGQTLSFYENNHHALGGKYLAGQLILVPEPSAIVGAGIGLLVVGWRRWSKRRGGRRSGDSIAAV